MLALLYLSFLAGLGFLVFCAGLIRWLIPRPRGPYDERLSAGLKGQTESNRYYSRQIYWMDEPAGKEPAHLRETRERVAFRPRKDTYVRNRTDSFADSDAAGRTTHVAPQPELGLLP